MTTTRHKAVQIEMLAESECTTEECAHEDECPTFLASVCLYCNAKQQGTEDMSLWEGRAARCPLYGTGVPVRPERAPWTDATPSEVRAIVEARRSSDPSPTAAEVPL
ncbi:MAG: hypothetical protein IJO71_02700 [Microbacterium sp.]|uniref:hypothetical protein n=1 Tax=Microbacterium sp. TaxID=51671 RepID=UPI0025FCA46E|nr:hypothetical protein [Microbacterium sp.]MBQ9916092.1 hypothetical protein [Microbacterium sp.]